MRSPFLPPADQPLLLTYIPTTNTLSQIRNMSGANRWQAAERYAQEQYGSPGQQYFNVPAGNFNGERIVGSGGCYVDAPVQTQVSGVAGIQANEVKMYKQWTTVNGQPTQQFVPLSDDFQQQVLKDSWLQTNVSGYRPNWLFLDAPPSPDLAQYLSDKSIPYVIYH